MWRSWRTLSTLTNRLYRWMNDSQSMVIPTTPLSTTTSPHLATVPLYCIPIPLHSSHTLTRSNPHTIAPTQLTTLWTLCNSVQAFPWSLLQVLRTRIQLNDAKSWIISPSVCVTMSWLYASNCVTHFVTKSQYHYSPTMSRGLSTRFNRIKNNTSLSLCSNSKLLHKSSIKGLSAFFILK